MLPFRHTLLLVTLAAAGIQSVSGAQAPAAPLTRSDAIDALLTREMAARHIPGLAVAIVDHGAVVFQRAYGTSNLETGTPVTTASVFELASLTKQFTAACILMLAEEGKVRLDEPITTYLDGAPAAWRQITVRHLLTHTSGLPISAIVGHDGSPLMNVSTKQAFDFVAASPLLSPPGARWAYSDAGYFLLGMIVERASGSTYREFMQRRIFDPLQMRESGIVDPARILKNHVSVYTLRDGELANWRRDWRYELPSFFGVVSTLGDLAKWDNALRNHTLVGEASLAQAWTPARLTNGMDAWPEYGFGWNLTDMRGHPVAEHSGASGTFLLHVIDAPLTIAVLTNLDVASGPHAAILAHRIAELFDADRYAPPHLSASAPPANMRDIEALLTDLAAGHDSPVMTLAHKAFYAELPPARRESLAHQLAARHNLAYVGSDSVGGRIHITDPIARIDYYRADVDGKPLLFTFYLTADGNVAQMRLTPQ